MNKIRITSGVLRGRTIKSPESELVHPMGSREKLALFNMISPSLTNAKVLDAYAGSGALGIEALSRGAKYVVFVEKDRKVGHILNKNIQDLNLANYGKVIINDVSNCDLKERFDIIIADPPYNKISTKPLFDLTKYIKDGGLFVLSHPDIAPVIDGLKLTTTHKYAKANISIYQK